MKIDQTPMKKRLNIL